MASSNTDETLSSSVSMQSNYILPPLISSDLSDGFLDLQWTTPTQLDDTLKTSSLSSTNDLDDPSTTPIPQLPNINTNSDSSPSADEDSNSVSPLLWVPADRHPEIAPSEFTKWLETNGTNTRKSTALRRKSSVLSQIHIPSDQQQPFADQETSLEFDRHSPAQDTSRVLAPRGNGSLLRRSAFSARGRGRKLTTNRHGEPPPSIVETTPSTKKEPVRLYDRPVSMSEWIDLGSASLLDASDDSQHGILSRVHDAESHLLSQLDPLEENNKKQEPKKDLLLETTPIPDETMPSTPIPSRPIQRASSERLPNRKSNSSWFGTLFDTKEKKRGSLRRVEDERQAKVNHKAVDEKVVSIKKSPFGSLFSRSKSTASNNRLRPKQQQPPPPPPLVPQNDGPSDRLPIHIERAIYRLSHFKLADPRRPLQHQVAISNFMFWYLSVINAQHPPQQQHPSQQHHPPQPTILSSPTNHHTPSKFHAHFDQSAQHHRDDDDLPLSYYKG